MKSTALMSYNACTFFQPDESRFTVAFYTPGRGYAIALKFLRCILFEEEKGERIIYDHISGLFIVHGSNLKDAFRRNRDDLDSFHQFDPKRHLPVTDNTAPIIRRIEVKQLVPGEERFKIPQHLLLVDD